MLLLTGLAVWKLVHGNGEENGSTVVILTSSISLYLIYLFATSSSQIKKK